MVEKRFMEQNIINYFLKINYNSSEQFPELIAQWFHKVVPFTFGKHRILQRENPEANQELPTHVLCRTTIWALVRHIIK